MPLMLRFSIILPTIFLSINFCSGLIIPLNTNVSNVWGKITGSYLISSLLSHAFLLSCFFCNSLLLFLPSNLYPKPKWSRYSTSVGALILPWIYFPGPLPSKAPFPTVNCRPILMALDLFGVGILLPSTT